MKIKDAFLAVLLASLSVLPIACATKSAAPHRSEFSGATPLEWSQRLADSEILRLSNSLAWTPGGKARWDYTAGLFTLSLLKLNEVVPTPRYVAFTEEAIGSFITANGTVQTYRPDEYQLDALNPAKTLLALWESTTNSDPRYSYACAKLVSQFEEQPRTPDGGFWHKQRYTNQMWLDGIYMGLPFYAAMGRYLKEPGQAYDEVVKQILLIDRHTYDAKSGLNYHGWDAAKIQPWANPQTGCSPNFWGRAEGWYVMALVDVLDFLPKDHPGRAQIIEILKQTAAGIVKWQDPKTGVWWQVMDQGGREGNYLEATASSMFVYSLAKGVNHGYLSRDYIPAIEKGYAGIIKQFIRPDGDNRWSLTRCCSVAGLGFKNAAGRSRDGSFNYYVSEPIVDNDLKGVGPFVLAGIELNRLPDAQ